MIDRSGSLLATVRTALDASPPAVAEPGTLRLHTLFSIPRQVKSLFPLAHIHPTDLEYNKKAASIGALEEQIFVTASWVPLAKDDVEGAVEATKAGEGGETRPSKETARDRSAPLLILAMELYLYTIPELGSAVLYVSKLDSSGYGPKTIPTPLREALSRQVFADKDTKFGNTLTATLSSAVTQHFTSFKHWDATSQSSSSVQVSHLSVHILARSQRAYLFPSSPENKDKKVLSDGGLIKWWRAVMSDVVVSSRDETSAVRKTAKSKGGAIDARAFYVIPGYSKMESHPLVPLVREADSSSTASQAGQVLKQAKWNYGHPYSSGGASCPESDLPPLPLHWQSSSFVLSNSDTEKDKVPTNPDASDYDPRRVRTVPTLMPHFSDDPKTRFLDEMARDAHEHSGWKKKVANGTSEPKAPGVTNEEKENGIESELDVSSFKGEAISNGTKRPAEDSTDDSQSEKKVKTDIPTTSSSSGVPLVTLRAQMRERQSMDDLPIDEFWERMAFRQECCSGNAVGVLVILFTRLPPSSSASSGTTVERQPLSLPYKVLGDLVFKSLMKDSCEWNKVTLARQLTESWFQGVDREVRRKGGLAQWKQEVGREEDELATLVGRGTIWADFVLNGPTKEQLDKSKKEAETKQNGNSTGTTAPGGGANMLSVKRKKKPAA
ncbi:histone H3-K56 acetyltransferase [Kalmanozyma brasiliensis GHG001]|uniref:histone acetyltransferase n=1 Tax=Kalmanozyma brasiliensis (strain GHG001) TaxID=1365824 RepID=V5E6B8_KALBG|nr:histone H3-K56 acetyltransferase [Kalmanozyma brasiliensis GHG001]EST05811.1 histone H3-K56 acetyltransferase [Kalmanozyma brasiliensis GHG001]